MNRGKLGVKVDALRYRLFQPVVTIENSNEFYKLAVQLLDNLQALEDLLMVNMMTFLVNSK